MRSKTWLYGRADRATSLWSMGKHLLARVHVRRQVVVREHDALGVAGRARGIDDAREVFGLHGVGELLGEARRRRLDLGALGFDARERHAFDGGRLVERDDVGDGGELVPDPGDLGLLLVVRHDDGHRSRVVRRCRRSARGAASSRAGRSPRRGSGSRRRRGTTRRGSRRAKRRGRRGGFPSRGGRARSCAPGRATPPTRSCATSRPS